ncbi:MAG: formyltetrahydrofolate deformylase [Candidatus Omnitrophica bacterium]|nr:formyltetrahydrofolate deformylase [Candidatus Omnitrophota bacterium]
MANAILLISCPDQRGITAAVTGFVFQHNGNILHADQHIDDQTNTFFMRLEWAIDGLDVSAEEFARQFQPIADRFAMRWHLNFPDPAQGEALPRVAIFVSKQIHCLYDLLLRQRSGQLACVIPVVISNHPNAAGVAKDFGVSFYEFIVTKENKAEQEQKQQEILRRERVELIVLARYHQIFSRSFVEQYPDKIINIHHSFLPAFAGSNPYGRAYERGVKLIGATAHYVTEQLDEGPIIEQDTTRVSHRDSVADMVRKGEDLEKVALSRAVRWHLEMKILRYQNKTVIFD